MLSTFIKLPFVIKIFVLSIFEWRFYTGFTGLENDHIISNNSFVKFSSKQESLITEFIPKDPKHIITMELGRSTVVQW